jgi:integrase
VLHDEQAKRFLTAAKKDRLSALWHVLLDGGLRPGEAFALQWRHVDFERGVVKVRQTLTRVGVPKRKDGKLGWMLTDPKTKSSKGDVPLSELTMKELKHWKAKQNEERLLIGKEWEDHGFVFTTEFGTPIGNNMGRVWERLVRAADCDGDLGAWGEHRAKPRSGPTPQPSFAPRFSMYVLRHTCATLALLDGVDLLQVSRRLRHKNITITARFYGHMKAEHTKQAAESFNRLAASIS